MPIDPKLVTVFLDASPSGWKRATRAADLAQRWNAHLTGAYVVFAGMTTLPPYMINARGDKAVADVLAYEDKLHADAMAATDRVSEHFQNLCAGLKVSGEFLPIVEANAIEEAIRVVLTADLVIVGNPEPNGLLDGLSPEKLLLRAGAPLLIVPNEWEGESIGQKILIGWNSSREARRAVADAMAFLVAARSVTVLVIDPAQQRGKEPGSDITVNLNRHGANVHLEQLPSLGHSIPGVLLDYAAQNAADLLVVGAYSHTRLQEFILGGTTQTLLAKTSVPTLMSR